MSRHPFTVLAATVAASMMFAIAASVASASSVVTTSPPPGSLFSSDFSSYSTDWQTVPWAVAPTITQLTETTSAESDAVESFGRFSSLDSIDAGFLPIEDLEISLHLDSIEADRVELLLAWFDGARWLDSTRVLDIDGDDDTSQPFIATLAGVTAPVDTTGFVLLFFVRGGTAVFDNVALYPDFTIPVPEPSTALLLGLGLVALGGLRREARAR